ncbi:unnamed protein product [Aphanomyces euteiches]
MKGTTPNVLPTKSRVGLEMSGRTDTPFHKLQRVELRPFDTDMDPVSISSAVRDADVCMEATACISSNSHATLSALFEATALQYPDHVALSCAKDVTSHQVDSLTYAETLHRAKAAACQLQGMFSECDPSTTKTPFVIGILLSKSLDLTLAILATTFAGATWLPFDPDAPPERVAVCLQDAGASALFYDQDHSEIAVLALQGLKSCRGILYSSLEKTIDALKTPQLLWKATPTTPAYYIYTSGTTGTPKGISISHRAAATFAYSESSVLKLTEKDIMWNGFSPAFDMWVEETWCAFARGTHLAVALGGQWQDITTLCRTWEARQVTVITAVPTLMAMVCNEGKIPQSVRLINMGGEACPPALVTRLHRPNLELFNTYGPSETTVTATYSIMTPEKGVTIGRPLPHYHALILQESDDDTEVIPQPLKTGVVGELAIGGPCVGDGYVGRPDLTKKKFIRHPTRPGETIYRSGDLVSLNTDGDIVFIGRIDTQVKYRGFRIELGEIEANLCAQDGVLAAAVILAKGDSNDESNPDRLEAYIVMEQGLTMNVNLLRSSLAAKLMAYMLPDVFFQLGEHEMPRLISGKIDKKGLVKISQDNRVKEKHVLLTMAKSSEKIATGLDFIMHVLRQLFPTQEKITPDMDVFTDLGCHSLLVATIVSRLRKGHPNLADNPFQLIGLADIYTLRTLNRLAVKFTAQTPCAQAAKRAFHQVTSFRYAMCGLLQVVGLTIVFALNFVSQMGPIVLYHMVYRKTGSIWPSLLAVYVFDVVMPMFFASLAITAKWILLGCVVPGDHPIFGWFYLRWWFVNQLHAMVPTATWGDTQLLVLWLQLWGASIGQHVHIGYAEATCADLITIGDGVSLGQQVIFGCAVVDQGLLKLRRITVGNNACIGTGVTLEGDVHIGDGVQLASMSGVPEGTTIPANQQWEGSPAKFQAKIVDPWQLDEIPPSWQRDLILVGQLLIHWLLLPIFDLVPWLPIVVLSSLSLGTGHGAVLSPILASLVSAVAYIFLCVTMLVLTKYLVLGKVQPGTYSTTSFFFLHKWTFDIMMQLSLQTLHSLYATLYVAPFLRLLGAKVGARSEVSTASMVVDLIELDEECFIADNVTLGDDYIRGYTLQLEKTKLGKRSFVGNGCLIPQGMSIPSNTLIGVFSKPPTEPELKEGESCFGLPAILMPTRRNVTKDFDASVLFNPSWTQYCLRLLVEGLRILYPPLTVSLGMAWCLQWVVHHHSVHYLSWRDVVVSGLRMLAAAPLYYFVFFVAPAIALMISLKWLLVGKYKPVEWPMWSLNVYLSEFVTSVMEHLTPLALSPFTGTPFLPMIFRLLGTKVGKRCYMGVVDIPEFDCVEIGDDCAFNAASFPQTHLFEDRVMKIGRVRVGDRCTMRLSSILLPQSSTGDDVSLGCNSVAMKGEHLTSGYEWCGFPVDIWKPAKTIDAMD